MLEAIEKFESGEFEDEFEYYAIIQLLINSGSAWGFQGSYGRTRMDAIESGHCMLARTDCRDYWGNHIPSRDQVQDGTKGSIGYVAQQMGDDWAHQMSEVE